jgi:type IV pilus assembly protein PilB
VAIDEAIGKYYERSISPEEIIGQLDESELSVLASEEDVNVVDLERASGEAPVIRLVNYIILGAIKKGASDIHVEPYERAVRVRYRIDGVLYEELSPPPRLKAAIASRLKIMANLDIAERRLPADGRIRLRLSGGREMDFRVSTVPTLFGEKVVLRLLDRGNLQLDMTRLGFEVEQLKQFQKAIHQPFGMVLVTGPTGSGKTTTLYSALAELNQTSDNICTAEDPVEFNLPGINQVQMHEEIGLNFATALRAFLRQDPDIVMVGEIRDFETAEIAIKAALTGHIVLSTVHTNDAPSTITRLLNMGIEPFLVTAAVNLICAQRLVRRVCSECRQPAEVRHEQLVSLGMSEELIGSLHLFRGSGCRHCHNTGYRGRVALYEVMPFCDSLQEMVLQGASTAEIRAEAVRLGMQTLRMSGVTKVAQGVTTVEEVMRVTGFE